MFDAFPLQAAEKVLRGRSQQAQLAGSLNDAETPLDQRPDLRGVSGRRADGNLVPRPGVQHFLYGLLHFRRAGRIAERDSLAISNARLPIV